MTNSDPQTPLATVDDLSPHQSAPDESALDEILPRSADDEPAVPTSTEPETSTPQPVANDMLVGLVTDLRTATETFSARADFYEHQVRLLQQRIEILQADQVQQLLGPAFQRLAILLTQAADSAGRARRDHGTYQADVEFDYFHDLVLETLHLMNADSVEALPGAAFDRTLHAARKTVATPDASLDGTVAKVLRQGVIRHGADRAFIPAQVSVYRYSASAPPAVSPDTSVNTPQPGREGDQS